MRNQQGRGVALTQQQTVETVPQVTPYEIEIILTGLCRFPDFLKEAVPFLRDHYFQPASELEYLLLWKAINAVQERYGQVSLYSLTAEVQQLLAPMQGAMPDHVMDSVLRQDGAGLIWSCAQTPIDAGHLPFIQHTFQRFLHERSVVVPMRRLMMQGLEHGSYVAQMGQLLEEVTTQHAAISSLQQVPRVDMAPPVGTEVAPAMVFKPTGVPWYDSRLRGQLVGSVNGIIGVIGAGKTTLAAHFAAAGAKQCWLDAQLSRERPELVVLITAEEPARMVLPRVQSAAMLIPRTKLAEMRSWSELTTSANLAAYERELVAQPAGGPPVEVLSELDRYQMNRGWLQQCCELLDLSGSEEFPHAGEGFVQELVVYMDALLRRRGNPQLRTVIIDWAGILCARHMYANNIDDSKLRNYLLRFVTLCKQLLAQRYGASVWIMHQIKADAITASSTRLFHHGDAAEGKAFGTELTVCGCIGVPDKETGCRRLNFSKVRYMKEEEIPRPMVIRIHDQFQLIEDAGNLYGVDEASGRFATVADLSRTQGMEAARDRRAGGPARVGTGVTSPRRR